MPDFNYLTSCSLLVPACGFRACLYQHNQIVKYFSNEDKTHSKNMTSMHALVSCTAYNEQAISVLLVPEQKVGQKRYTWGHTPLRTPFLPLLYYEG